MHAAGVIRTNNTIKQAAAGPGLRPRGHWNRQLKKNYRKKKEVGNDSVGTTIQDNGDYLTSPKQ